MGFKPFVLSLSLFCLLFGTSVSAGNWRITKETWSASDEELFSQFVAALGESGCRTMDQCMKNPANPYRSSDPARANFRSDCADFPYLLRAYFASKNGLPFSYESGVTFANSRADSGRNIRYTAYGNRVTARTDITVTDPRDLPDHVRIMERLSWGISSAMFRIDPTNHTADSATLFSDVYPIRISRETVKPGTVIYDPNGHVAIVYKVEDDGRIRFMDAHPDSSVTRGTYSNRFARGRPTMAGGLKNWRPIRLVGARRDSSGLLVGGHVEAVTNHELGDHFSLEQYLGNVGNLAADQWRLAQFQVMSPDQTPTTVDFYDFVRVKMSRGDLRYNAIDEFRNMVRDLCTDLRDRVTAVDEAIHNGIQNKAHPDALPDNIYGTNDMEWETYSTPSRDARLKTAFKDLRDQTQRFIEMQRSGDRRLVYTGNNLAQDLLRVFYQESQACPIVYTRSNGTQQTLLIPYIIDRLYMLSFDPYHCPERRWGAFGAELATCVDSAADAAWYSAEQVLRNQIDRTYDVRMGFSLRELQALDPVRARVGVAQAPDSDVESYLMDLVR